MRIFVFYYPEVVKAQLASGQGDPLAAQNLSLLQAFFSWLALLSAQGESRDSTGKLSLRGGSRCRRPQACQKCCNTCEQFLVAEAIRDKVCAHHCPVKSREPACSGEVGHRSPYLSPCSYQPSMTAQP